MRRPTRLIASLAAASLTACSSGTEPPQADLVVRGATVIDGTGAALRPDTDIFVSEGEITAVVPGGSAAVPEGATVVGMLDAGPFVDSLAKWREDTDATTRWVGTLHALGVPVALGTDVGNPMVFAGFTAHEELAHLVEAGLSPMEAIQAASIEAARMIGKEDEFGSIEVGKRADLLILDADPLDDIRNSRRIRGVIARGRVVDRQALRRPN